MLALELLEKAPYDLTLQVLLRTAEVAGQNWKRAHLRVGTDVVFCAVDERANDGVQPVVGQKLWRHGLELARKEEVEKERDDHVVAMMTEGNLRAAELGREAIED